MNTPFGPVINCCFDPRRSGIHFSARITFDLYNQYRCLLMRVVYRNSDFITFSGTSTSVQYFRSSMRPALAPGNEAACSRSFSFDFSKANINTSSIFIPAPRKSKNKVRSIAFDRWHTANSNESSEWRENIASRKKNRWMDVEQINRNTNALHFYGSEVLSIRRFEFTYQSHAINFDRQRC